MGESEYILHVGDSKFLLSIQEAMDICKVLNSAMRVETGWFKDVPSDRRHIFSPPSFKAAFVTPVTAALRIEVESNMKAQGNQ